MAGGVVIAFGLLIWFGAFYAWRTARRRAAQTAARFPPTTLSHAREGTLEIHGTIVATEPLRAPCDDSAVVHFRLVERKRTTTTDSKGERRVVQREISSAQRSCAFDVRDANGDVAHVAGDGYDVDDFSVSKTTWPSINDDAARLLPDGARSVQAHDMSIDYLQECIAVGAPVFVRGNAYRDAFGAWAIGPPSAGRVALASMTGAQSGKGLRWLAKFLLVVGAVFVASGTTGIVLSNL